jgi:hypothetical protein
MVNRPKDYTRTKTMANNMMVPHTFDKNPGCSCCMTSAGI